jgi:Protein phosphatase 2C
VQEGSRRQDAFACSVTAGIPSQLIAVLCDGAGSASKGGEGASLTARIISLRAREHLMTLPSAPDDETIRTWIDEAREAIYLAAKKRDLSPRDFASTLVAALSNGSETTVIHIGDGCAVAKDTASGEWQTLTWPAHGEYASTTFFVTDEEPRLSIQRRNEPISALVAFTDGMERLALDFAATKPHAPFFEGMLAPLLQRVAKGRDAYLSQQLARYLDSPAVNARTDDDKTLLVATLR